MSTAIGRAGKQIFANIESKGLSQSENTQSQPVLIANSSIPKPSQPPPSSSFYKQSYMSQDDSKSSTGGKEAKVQGSSNKHRKRSDSIDLEDTIAACLELDTKEQSNSAINTNNQLNNQPKPKDLTEISPRNISQINSQAIPQNNSQIASQTNMEKEELLAALEVLKMQNQMLTNRIEKNNIESLQQLEQERQQKKQAIAKLEFENQQLLNQLLSEKEMAEKLLDQEKTMFIQSIKDMEVEKDKLQQKIGVMEEEAKTEAGYLLMQSSEMQQRILILEQEKQQIIQSSQDVQLQLLAFNEDNLDHISDENNFVSLAFQEGNESQLPSLEGSSEGIGKNLEGIKVSKDSLHQQKQQIDQHLLLVEHEKTQLLQMLQQNEMKTKEQNDKLRQDMNSFQQMFQTQLLKMEQEKEILKERLLKAEMTAKLQNDAMDQQLERQRLQAINLVQELENEKQEILTKVSSDHNMSGYFTSKPKSFSSSAPATFANPMSARGNNNNNNNNLQKDTLKKQNTAASIFDDDDEEEDRNQEDTPKPTDKGMISSARSALSARSTKSGNNSARDEWNSMDKSVKLNWNSPQTITEEEQSEYIQHILTEKTKLQERLKASANQAKDRVKTLTERLQQKKKEKLSKLMSKRKEEVVEEKKREKNKEKNNENDSTTNGNVFMDPLNRTHSTSNHSLLPSRRSLVDMMCASKESYSSNMVTNTRPDGTKYEILSTPPLLPSSLLSTSPKENKPKPKKKDLNLNEKTFMDDDSDEEHAKKEESSSSNEAFGDLPAPHSAAAIGDIKRLDVLFKLDEELLRSLDSVQRQPLFYAAAYSQLDAIQYFFVFPDIMTMLAHADMYGDTAIHAAAATGNTTCLEFILSKSNTLDTSFEHELHAHPLVNIPNSIGVTAAHLAGNVETLELLVQYGANLSQVDNYERSPLLYACAINRAPCVEYLLSCLDPDEDVLLKTDSRGDTPLHAAACNGSLESLLILLQYGVDPRIENNQHLKAIDLAIRNKHTKCREVLAEYILHYCTSSEFDSVLFLATLEGHRMISHFKNTHPSNRSNNTPNFISPRTNQPLGTNHQVFQSMFSLRGSHTMKLQRYGHWIAYHDPGSEAIFWYNHETGEGQWDMPSDVKKWQDESEKNSDIFDKTLQAKMSMRLKRDGDWIHYTTEKGKTFYYNEKDGSFQWENPNFKKSNPLEDHRKKKKKNKENQRSDWKPYLDESTGVIFWYNHVTKVSQWEDPFEDDDHTLDEDDEEEEEEDGEGEEEDKSIVQPLQQQYSARAKLSARSDQGDEPPPNSSRTNKQKSYNRMHVVTVNNDDDLGL